MKLGDIKYCVKSFSSRIMVPLGVIAKEAEGRKNEVMDLPPFHLIVESKVLGLENHYSAGYSHRSYEKVEDVRKLTENIFDAAIEYVAFQIIDLSNKLIRVSWANMLRGDLCKIRTVPIEEIVFCLKSKNISLKELNQISEQVGKIQVQVRDNGNYYSNIENTVSRINKLVGGEPVLSFTFTRKRKWYNPFTWFVGKNRSKLAVATLYLCDGSDEGANTSLTVT